MSAGPAERELAVLRAVRLRLIAPTEHVARAVGLGDDEAQAALEGAAAAGLVTSTARGWRLAPDGQARLDALLAAERAAVDRGAAGALHGRFVALDHRVKDVVTGHQLSGDAELAPERAAELAAVHAAVAPVVADAVALAPRLAPYGRRLDDAHRALVDGDPRFLAHPLVDSYHTVWFELHEELIHLAGLSRSELDESHAPS